MHFHPNACHRLPLYLTLTIAFVLFGATPSFPREAPFTAGEKLSYMISWSFIPAARATLEIKPLTSTAPNDAGYHFVMTAHTLPAIALIYPFRERIDSYVSVGLEHSLLYKKYQESGHPRDITVRFDWGKGTTQYSNFGQLETPIPVPPDTLDPLSALYYIRTQKLVIETAIERSVTDGKKLSRGRASILKKETLTIHGKSYQTIKVEPDLREVKGVFEKSPGASMFIWLTDDDRKLLVKLKSKVRVGSFIAELLEKESVIAGTAIVPDARKAKSGAEVSYPWEIRGNSTNTP